MKRAMDFRLGSCQMTNIKIVTRRDESINTHCNMANVFPKDKYFNIFIVEKQDLNMQV